MFPLLNLPVDVVFIILSACYSGDLHSLSLVSRCVSQTTEERRSKILALTLPPFNIKNSLLLSTSIKYLAPGWHPKLGCEGMNAMCSAIEMGALPQLRLLRLSSHLIGDVGFTTFCRSISNGSVGALTLLKLSNNMISNAGMIEFSRSINTGSMGKLKWLDLSDNRIGDAGIFSLSNAMGKGSLASLEWLYINNNLFGPVTANQLNIVCNAREIKGSSLN
jgi:hypothetical protein